MKIKVTYLLLLCGSLFLTNVNAAPKALPVGVAARVSCVGAQPFFFGFTYFPGQRVVFNNQLYQAISTSSGQWPTGSPSWIWLGPCN
ncbi:hypothetical protein KTO58_12060 [Chitinophaga pendula]|uniref:hypothetical protein n=1 Tax=Chitinophaga TaxID=79328 RepID=UPI0012FE4FB0|nr:MULTISPECIES: hypothetical protein [Chitinophaga]UCJ09895.1 hypothetical protein KTO58_12060 [Chitinophaga pendula]